MTLRTKGVDSNKAPPRPTNIATDSLLILPQIHISISSSSDDGLVFGVPYLQPCVIVTNYNLRSMLSMFKTFIIN